jgi:cytochrome c oxidase cbb3-type subunit 3
MTDNNKKTMNSTIQDDKLFADHNYDGIRELNNPSPYWVLLLFLGTIGFSLFYAVHYFGFPNNGRDQISEYNKQMAMADNQPSSQSPSDMNAAFVFTKEQMAEGAKIFLEKGCIACHGTKGEGNAIGPNMTDKFWVHGCKPAELLKVITDGIPEKGMAPYKAMMTGAQMKSVIAYILGTLVGSNPPNAKAPQGVECK